MIGERVGLTGREVQRMISRGRLLRKLNNYLVEKIYTEETFMKQIGLKLSLKQIKELEFLSQELGLPKSEIIRRALDEYFDNLKLRKAKINSLLKT